MMWLGLVLAALLAALPVLLGVWTDHTDAGLRASIWWLNLTRPLSPDASRWRNRLTRW